MFKNSKWVWLTLWLVALTVAAAGFIMAVCLNPHLIPSYKIASSSGIFIGWVIATAISIGVASDL